MPYTLMFYDNNTASSFMAFYVSVCVCVLFWEIMNTAWRINYSNNSQAPTTLSLLYAHECVRACNLRSSFIRQFIICHLLLYR